MEPELDMFDQWAKERSEKSWIVRKIQWIPLWWDQEGRYIHREIARGFKNIWYWFPVIWKDRHWDSHYIFDIMMHKIKAQSKYIGDRGIHTRAERDAEIMMSSVRLMKLVQDETYSSEYSDYHKTKHWFEPADKEGYSTWESRILEEDFDGYIKKYPLIEKRVMEGEGIFSLDGEDSLEIKQRIAMNIGQINHNRARKLLFKLMEENIERW
jgi:hypothetical protein|tara:strand:+ start:71 stop:703 length:633 start_codon:yes stop_codon:yes gene_type:complete